MIRDYCDSDWSRVEEIYYQGIEEGNSTFSYECPSKEDWDKGHLKCCRYVYEEAGKVVGWLMVSPTSSKPAYSGSVEMSIYIDKDYRRRGIGRALIEKLLNEARKNGIWSVYSVIFSINEGSIELHKKCGFRLIGYRERIAKDIFGQWQNTTLMEYRLSE